MQNVVMSMLKVFCIQCQCTESFLCWVSLYWKFSMLSLIILKFFYTECHIIYCYAECHNTGWHHPECHIFIIMLCVSVMKVFYAVMFLLLCWQPLRWMSFGWVSFCWVSWHLLLSLLLLKKARPKLKHHHLKHSSSKVFAHPSIYQISGLYYKSFTIVIYDCNGSANIQSVLSNYYKLQS